MSYYIAAISNSGGAPEQAYRKMQTAGACPDRPYAGECQYSLLVVCCFLLLHCLD